VDTSIQSFLNKLVDDIEKNILETGYAVPRTEIMGYLLEFFVVDANLTEERLKLLIGDVPDITQDIISRKDVEWPQAPWYGRQIEYPFEMDDVSDLNQATSSQFMRAFQYIHGILLLPSVYVLILVLMSFSLALIRQDPNSFEISVGISLNPLNLFYYYAIHSIIIFPLTARLSNNKQLRSGVDDMEEWVTNIKKFAYFQTFSYGMFSFMMFMGSFAVVKIGTPQATLTEKPANGIPLITTLYYILFASFVYYHGIRRLWTGASGGSLKDVGGKPKSSIISSILGLTYIIQNVVIILNAYLTIELLDAYSEVTGREDAIHVLNRSIIYTVLTIIGIYGIINSTIIFYLRRVEISNYSISLRKSTIQNNYVQTVNWGLFVSVYIILRYKLISLSPNKDILDLLISGEFVLVLFSITLFIGMIKAILVLTDQHSEM
jgi:hypothetical protein